jgi:hypothetical protein
MPPKFCEYGLFNFAVPVGTLPSAAGEFLAGEGIFTASTVETLFGEYDVTELCLWGGAPGCEPAAKSKCQFDERDESAVRALASAIGASMGIQSVSLRHTSGLFRARAVVTAFLPDNFSVRTIDLCNCGLTAEDAALLARAMPRNRTVVEWCFEANPRLGDAGAEALIDALVKGSVVQRLSMRRCGIEDVRTLLDKLTAVSSLYAIDFRENAGYAAADTELRELDDLFNGHAALQNPNSALKHVPLLAPAAPAAAPAAGGAAGGLGATQGYLGASMRRRGMSTLVRSGAGGGGDANNNNGASSASLSITARRMSRIVHDDEPSLARGSDAYGSSASLSTTRRMSRIVHDDDPPAASATNGGASEGKSGGAATSTNGLSLASEGAGNVRAPRVVAAIDPASPSAGGASATNTPSPNAASRVRFADDNKSVETGGGASGASAAATFMAALHSPSPSAARAAGAGAVGGNAAPPVAPAAATATDTPRRLATRRAAMGAESAATAPARGTSPAPVAAASPAPSATRRATTPTPSHHRAASSTALNASARSFASNHTTAHQSGGVRSRTPTTLSVWHSQRRSEVDYGAEEWRRKRYEYNQFIGLGVKPEAAAAGIDAMIKRALTPPKFILGRRLDHIRAGGATANFRGTPVVARAATPREIARYAPWVVGSIAAQKNAESSPARAGSPASGASTSAPGSLHSAPAAAARHNGATRNSGGMSYSHRSGIGATVRVPVSRDHKGQEIFIKLVDGGPVSFIKDDPRDVSFLARQMKAGLMTAKPTFNTRESRDSSYLIPKAQAPPLLTYTLRDDWAHNAQRLKEDGLRRRCSSSGAGNRPMFGGAGAPRELEAGLPWMRKTPGPGEYEIP